VPTHRGIAPLSLAFTVWGLGAVFLRERFTARRAGATVAVLAGLVAMRL